MAATMTDEKRDKLPADAREKLDAAVREMATSEGFKRWLDTQSKFHRYSFNNTMLIAFQCPHATQVAGYRKWQEMNRHVMRGEHGIRILAPVTITVDADGNRVKPRTPGSKQIVVGFKVVSVFDVSQTDGEPLGTPPPMQPLDGDAPDGMLDMLGAVADAEGLTVEYLPIPIPGLSGFLDESKKRVVLKKGEHGAESAAALAHELAHHFDPNLHDAGEAPTGDARATYMHERGDCEAVAEAASYIVSAAFGLDAGDSAVGYVVAYAKGDPDVIKRLAQRIDATVRRILDYSRKENGKAA